jgi:DNA helicase-2/ATP-dependent DNA helicase PcrA
MAAWQGQVERVRQWYQPLLELRHDDAFVRAADLDSARFRGRSVRLARTLPHRGHSGPALGEQRDLAGTPLLNEDYLILSTVHSAKGQEWDAVYVLNVADGNFPNEYATGRTESIEEERRLLYVAMTRARDSLSLLEPLRFHVTQQPRYGDAHVHAARSRFLTAELLKRFERVAPRAETQAAGSATETSASLDRLRVDVAGKLRGMW